MNYKGIDIVCPVCKADLRKHKENQYFSCVSCKRDYPIVLGIPDFRLFDDPYISKKEDWDRGRTLFEKYGGLDFSESLDLYYSHALKVPQNQAKRFKEGLMAAVPRAEAALDSWELASGSEQKISTFLEIGCGSAPLLVIAANRYKKVVGIDIAFRWLVIAKKRLSEVGMDIPLICGCAEALPFPDEIFDQVAAESVLEHLRDQQGALKEFARVMRPNSYLFLATPNRYRLGPDPHVGLWAGGFLPQWLINLYMHGQEGLPPQRRLLSIRSLSRLIKEAGFTSLKIYLPDIPHGQRKQFSKFMNRLIDLYHLTKRIPGGRQVLNMIGPLLHAVARKPYTAAP